MALFTPGLPLDFGHCRGYAHSTPHFAFHIEFTLAGCESRVRDVGGADVKETFRAMPSFYPVFVFFGGGVFLSTILHPCPATTAFAVIMLHFHRCHQVTSRMENS